MFVRSAVKLQKRRNQVTISLLLAVLFFASCLPIWAKPLPKAGSTSSKNGVKQKVYVSEESHIDYKKIPEQFKNRKLDPKISGLLYESAKTKAANKWSSGVKAEKRYETLHVKSKDVAATKENLVKLGGKHVRNLGNTVLVKFPLDEIPNLVADPSILYVKDDKKFYTTVHDALGDKGIDLCYDDLSTLNRYTGCDGRGVIIAVPGLGIDPTRFPDENGNTRVLNYVDGNATGEIRFTMPALRKGQEGQDMVIQGKEYTSSDIDAGKVKSVGKGDHDTLTAGLAAGSITDKTRGVAPKANLILFECEGDPDVGWMSESSIIDGIIYSIAKANEFDKPLVVNLSLGGFGGDIRCDGKDDFSLELSKLIKASNINLKVVCSAGNEGYIPAWLFSSTKCELKLENLHDPDNMIIGGSDFDKYLDFALDYTLPYSPKLSLEITEYEDARCNNKKSTVFEKTFDANEVAECDTIVNGDFEIYFFKHLLNSDNYYADDEKPCEYQHIFVDVASSEFRKKYFKVSIKNVGAGDTLVRGYTLTTLGYWPSAIRVDQNNLGGTIAPPGSCPDAITVGAYGKDGKLAYFSSTGPLRNMANRYKYAKPEITAIGMDIANGLFPSWMEADDDYTIDGTSFSAPIVSGLVALLLQKYPDASAEEIKQILIESAIADEFTDTTPNNKWGYGKANAQALDVEKDIHGPTEEPEDDGFTETPEAPEEPTEVPTVEPTESPEEPTEAPTVEPTESPEEPTETTENPEPSADQPTEEPSAVIMPIDAGNDGGGCFIATAAWGSYLEEHVVTLRQFRDNCLKTNAPGRAFVMFYYKNSPPVAKFIAAHEWARLLTRLALTPIVYAIAYPAWAALVMLLSLSGCGLIVCCRMQRKVA